MTQVISKTLDDGNCVSSFPVHEYWLYIGNHDQYAQTQNDYHRYFANASRLESAN